MFAGVLGCTYTHQRCQRIVAPQKADQQETEAAQAWVNGARPQGLLKELYAQRLGRPE